MTDIHKPVSLAGQVFERIEKEILLGGYAYGTILTETQLCKDLGVSRTPVREALFRLEEEHLVRTTPKGVQVLGITEQDLKDIYDVRILLEPLAGKLCCERCTEDEKQEMKDTIELQEFYVQKRNPEQIRALDSSFHTMLYTYSGSKVLEEILVPLHRKVQKYRQVSVSDPGRAEESSAEHRKILEAILEGNAQKAEDAVCSHVMKARERMLNKAGKAGPTNKPGKGGSTNKAGQIGFAEKTEKAEDEKA